MIRRELIDKMSLLVNLRNWKYEQYAEIGHETEYDLLEKIIHGIENEPAISDRKIRDKAIEGIQEVVDSMEIYTAGRLNANKVEMSVLQMQRFINRLKEIAEQMKEVGE